MSRLVTPTILITTFVDDDLLSGLPAGARIVRGDDRTTTLTRAEVLVHAGNCEALLYQNEFRIDREFLDCAPRLKVVATATAGFDKMDQDAMAAANVWGTNCPDSFATATADHALALLLALAKRVLEGDAYVRSGQWPRDGWTPGRWDGITLEGRMLGIVGYGRIGRAVARRASAFGMRVQHCRSGASDVDGAVSLPILLATSDVVSLHCPLDASTRHLISAESLALMKPGAMLLNLARGPVVDEQALVAALRAGRLAGAGLDVFEHEPRVSEELLSMTNVVMTPHVGGGTRESKRAAWALCVENVRLVLSGRPPQTPVARPSSASNWTPRSTPPPRAG